jgi:hypothetical protein
MRQSRLLGERRAKATMVSQQESEAEPYVGKNCPVGRFFPTFWHYSGFGTKLSPFFGFAKSSQIQDHISIKPNAQIRCSGCYELVVSS